MSSKKLITILIGIVVIVVLGIIISVSGTKKEADQGLSGDSMMNTESGEVMIGENTESENGGEVMMENTGDVMKSEENAMMDKGDEKTEGSTMMVRRGSYEAYSPEKLALAENGKVVLFFRATWCPTCKALDSDINKNLSSIPDGVTILDVDYDNSTALKQKYGITYQHTMVLVDSSGNQITKWTGSPTLADLLENIK